MDLCMDLIRISIWILYGFLIALTDPAPTAERNLAYRLRKARAAGRLTAEHEAELAAMGIEQPAGSYMDHYMDPIWIPTWIPTWIHTWIPYVSLYKTYGSLYGSLYGSYMVPYMDPYLDPIWIPI